MQGCPVKYLALLLLAGCGLPQEPFKLTSGALYCGETAGLKVYVDNVDNVIIYSEGSPYESRYTVSKMSCGKALGTVDQALQMGASSGFFIAMPSDASVEFVGTDTLAAQGLPQALGATSPGPGGHIYAGYGYDTGDPTQISADPDTSAIVMVHEMTHLVHGGGDHCHWASLYASAYAQWTNGWASLFIDQCEHKKCRGSVCEAYP